MGLLSPEKGAGHYTAGMQRRGSLRSRASSGAGAAGEADAAPGVRAQFVQFVRAPREYLRWRARRWRTASGGGLGLLGDRHKHKSSDVDLADLSNQDLFHGGGLYRDRGKGRGRWRRACADRRVLVALFVLGAMAFHVVSIIVYVKKYPLRFRPCPETEPKASVESTLDGIVYICTDTREAKKGGCDIPLLCSSLMLLRGTANWAGRIYVVTEMGDHIRDICPYSDFIAVPTPKVDSLMEMKNFKRKLFDIIPAAPGEPARPRALMYVDGDILPVGCMDKFLADAEAVPSVAMFADTWCSGCNTYCGGFILMRDVPETTECFAAWDRELSRDNYALYSKDQDALDVVLRQGQCAGVQMLPYKYMQAVDKNLVWMTFDIIRGKVPIFQHFSHGLRKDLGSNFYFWPQYIWPQMYQAIEHQMRPYMPREWISPSERILNNVNADKELKPGQGGAGQQG